MPISATAALVGAGISAASKGVGAAIAAKKGTPGKSQTTSFAAASPEELDLQRQSIAQYMKQLELNNQQEAGISQYDPMRQQALQGYGDILGGQAFNMTAQEQQNIQNLRNSSIAQGTEDVNRYTQEGIRQVQGAAGTRNLRGQALGALQGQVVEQGQRQIGDITRQANQFAQQQAISLPYQRIQAQQPFLQQGLSYGDQLRQQAIQNRQLAQNPIALQRMQQERMAASTTSSPGQKGSVGAAIAGGLGGAIGGAGDFLNLAQGFNDIGALRGAAAGRSSGGGSGSSYNLGSGLNFDQFKS
jgi:hypothetical protein